MFSTAILLISGVLGFFWAAKARNQFTKLCSFLLGFAVLVLIVPHSLATAYAPYFLAFACIMAGFEPGSSRRITTFLKFFFGASGTVFAAVALDRIITWPFDIQFWPLVLLYFLGFGYSIIKNPKQVKTRLGALFIWAGLGLEHLLRVFF